MRTTDALVLAPALLGVAFGFRAWLWPGTGVTGTPGAMFAVVGAVSVALGSMLAAIPAVRGTAYGLLVALIGIGAALTTLAAWFLMQDAVVVAMALAFAGLIVAVMRPGGRPRRRLAR